MRIGAGGGRGAMAAVAALDQRGRRERRRARAWPHRGRGAGGPVCHLLPLTYVVTWAHRVVLTTSGFEKTVVPIGTDPAVTSAAAVAITNQIFTSLNPQQIVANALPPKAAFLAGPVTNEAKGYVQDAVTKSLQSSQFQVLWKQAVDFAHAQLLSVLNGNSKAVTTTNGQVVLNLVPLLNSALQEPGRLHRRRGRPSGEPADHQRQRVAVHRVQKDLDRPQPARARHLRADSPVPCRQAHRGPPRRAPLQRDRGVAAHSDAGGGHPGPVAVPSAAAHPAATVLSAVCWSGGHPPGGRTGLPIRCVDTGVPANKSARRAILSHLFHQYFSISRWLVLGIIIVFLAALISGPYPWAISLRRPGRPYGREGWNLVQAIGGRARDDSTAAWVRSHVDLLRVLGVGVAVLLIIHPSDLLDRIPGHRRTAGRLPVVALPAQALPAPDGATSTSSSAPPDDQPPHV